MKTIIVTISILGLLSACKNKEQQQKKAAEASPALQTTLVAPAAFSEDIKLPAQLSAYREVSIYPKVNGYVKSVLVDIGSNVQQGQLLMVLEAPELLQQSLQAKEKYERSRSDFAISRERYVRLRQASLTEGAVSPMDLAVARSKMEADSTLSRAEKANWDMQEIMIGYLRVTAPFSGIITERNVHPGALVSAVTKDKPMLELKEIRHLRLQVDVPEAIAAGMKEQDQVSFYLTTNPSRPHTASISRMSHNLNTQYRTQRVELDVPNPGNELAAGMYADVVIHSRSAPGAVAVPKTAVVTGEKNKYVLLVKHGRTVRADVITGIESQERIQVYGNLQVKDTVLLNPGTDTPEGLPLNR
jgi:membrane fusion protein (multidrug efflux system)